MGRPSETKSSATTTGSGTAGQLGTHSGVGQQSALDQDDAEGRMRLLGLLGAQRLVDLRRREEPALPGQPAK